MIDDQPLYNSRIISIFCALLKKRYPHVDLREVLEYAEITSYQVHDEGHWFTQRQVNRFHDKIEELAGGEISREAGRFAASSESLGSMTRYVLGLIGPANAFFAINKESAKLTRSASYTSRKIAGNSVEITVTPKAGTKEEFFQCENRIGFFEAILMMFDYDLPVIEHPECLFEGGDCCRYVVTWKTTTYAKLRTLRNYLLPPLAAGVIALGHFEAWFPAAQSVSLLCGLFLGCSYLAATLEKRELVRSLANLKESTDRHLEQISVNYSNALMVNEVGQAISTRSDIDEVLQSLIRVLEHRLGYDRGLILLTDARKSHLKYRVGFGFTEKQLEAWRQASFNVNDSRATGFFVRSFREQRAHFVEDLAAQAHRMSPDTARLSETMGARSFICCAIVCEGQSLGVLAVDNMKSKRKLLQSDLSLLTGIAPVIGMTLRNAMYVDRDRRMEEQVRQSQKMEAVGKLAGGIAHDFNNLLTGMIGFVTLVQMGMQAEDPARKLLDSVLTAADRATGLTQGLLAFSRKQVSHPQSVDLNGIVTNLEGLLKRLVTSDTRLSVSVHKAHLQLIADASQIDQILMNLVTNARDAMTGPGEVTIRTDSIHMDQDFVAAHGFGVPGNYALLSVSDTGTGMDEATLAHALDPFFTTKEVGKGTGLGLAIVYGIVKQHEGHLEIKSRPGEGTTFNIYLPLLKPQEMVVQTSALRPPVFNGAETVLVVEDAAEARQLTVQVLAQSGYQVIEASDDEDALRKFTAQGGEVDLVIVDAPPCDGGGNEALRQMTRINPRTRVLFTGGHGSEDASRRGFTFAKENFLAKPASPQLILKKVRDVLAA